MTDSTGIHVNSTLAHRSEDFIPPPDPWIALARHEAAHAVAALALGKEVAQLRLWREADGTLRGDFCHKLPSDNGTGLALDDLCDRLRMLSRGLDDCNVVGVHEKLVVLYAGLVQELSANEVLAFSLADKDLDDAEKLAGAISSSENHRSRMVNEAMMEAAAIVDRNRQAVNAIADRLAQTRIMTGDEIRQIASDAGFPAPIDREAEYVNPSEWPASFAVLRWRCDLVRRELRSAGWNS